MNSFWTYLSGVIAGLVVGVLGTWLYYRLEPPLGLVMPALLVITGLLFGILLSIKVA